MRLMPMSSLLYRVFVAFSIAFRSAAEAIFIRALALLLNAMLSHAGINVERIILGDSNTIAGNPRGRVLAYAV